MGNDAARANTTTTPYACGHPASGSPMGQVDGTQSKETGDAYATRHNPFVYFHSIIDVTTGPAACANHVVNLQRSMSADLASLATTPAFSFITPNLCDDAHDDCSATAPATGVLLGGLTGGLPGMDAYLKDRLIPTIETSAAYKKDGLIVITFDESVSNPDIPSNAFCCNEQGQQPGVPTTGGGVVGAVLLSPFIRGPVVDAAPYNHYSTLRSVEDMLGVTAPTINGTPYLGYASQAGDFAAADFNNRTTVVTNIPVRR